jgi:hypothetical protein
MRLEGVQAWMTIGRASRPSRWSAFSARRYPRRPVRVRSKASPRAVMLWRVVALAAIVGFGVSLTLLRQKQLDALDGVRRPLLEQIQRQADGLTDQQKALGVRTEALLARLAGPYEGEQISDGLRPGPSAAVKTRRCPDPQSAARSRWSKLRRIASGASWRSR